MPTLTIYAKRRAQGLCGRCGTRPAQAGHACCARCYTPTPRQVLFPGIRSGDPAYAQAYAWHRRMQQTPPLELGCCGQVWPVTSVPFTAPCCHKQYFLPKENV